MKVGFDAKRLFNNFTGLGNYSRFIVNALAENFSQDQFFLFTPKTNPHPDVQSVLQNKNIQVVTPPKWINAVKLGSVWRSWGETTNQQFQALDAFHGLSMELPAGIKKGIKKIVTIHDLIFIRFPELYNAVDVKIYTYKMKMACKQADVIIAISEQTKRDLIEFLHIPETKIEVVYQGVHEQFYLKKSKEEIEIVKTKYKLPNQYLLQVGTIEKRKNALLSIEALAKLNPSQKIPLVLIGRPTAYKETLLKRMHELGLSTNDVIFLERISFQDLPALYQGASVFLYPSFFEGFGIPIVEAAVSHIPIIAATGSCLEEAGGEASKYVQPNDSEGLVRHIEILLSDESLRNHQAKQTWEYVQQFSAKPIANQLMKIYTA
jgi:glycosyltransferase involved in cell wall biosynthesis